MAKKPDYAAPVGRLSMFAKAGESPEPVAPATKPRRSARAKAQPAVTAVADIDDLLDDEPAASEISEPEEAEQAPAPEQIGERRPARRRRRGPTVEVKIELDAQLFTEVRARGHRHFTGGQQGLPGRDILAAYILAVDELVGRGIDLSGIERGDSDALCDRVAEHILGAVSARRAA